MEYTKTASPFEGELSNSADIHSETEDKAKEHVSLKKKLDASARKRRAKKQDEMLIMPKQHWPTTTV